MPARPKCERGSTVKSPTCLVAALLGALFLTGCLTAEGDACNPGNCGGCCRDGVCEDGTAPSSCGSGGEQCASCWGTEDCLEGACVSTAADAGSGKDAGSAAKDGGSTKAENTNALCSDGIDNDGDGYTDCDDYSCSKNPNVTVCQKVPTLGMDCTNARNMCNPGERCVEGMDLNYTFTYRCRADVQGQPCPSTTSCGSFDDTKAFECIPGPGVCEARCRSDAECAAGEYCFAYAGPDKRCEKGCALVGTATCPAGRKCTLHQGLYQVGAYCVSSGQLGEGASCTPSRDGVDDCLPGLICASGGGIGSTCRRFCDATHACGTAHPLCLSLGVGWTVASGTSAGASVCGNACDQNPCTQPHRNSCTPNGSGATCGCNSGYADVGGSCVSTTPCAPDPCTAPHRTVCTASPSYQAVCSCDPGYADDGTGNCLSTTPCSPNPCTQPNKSVCTASGFTFSCGCDPGTVAVGAQCLASCPGGQHLDGDAFEPNECASQAAQPARTAAGAGALVSNSANIGPLSSDVDFYRTPGAASHVYWALLAADAPMCNGIGTSLDAAVSSTWRYAQQYSSISASNIWSCARQASQVANPAYQMAVIDFDVSDGDYSNSSTSPTVLPSGRTWAANTLSPAGDTDTFSFSLSRSTTVLHQGQSVYLSLEIRNPANGSVLSSLNAVCLQSLTPASCLSLSTTGTVEVRVTVSYEPQYASATPGLTAYYLGW